MLDIIEVNILETEGQLNAYQLAERLLTRIQQLGMLPPLSKTNDDVLNELIMSSEPVNGRIYDSDNVMSYFTWEPEDD